ncbi:MAG: hypothetical protein ABIH65_02825 [Nanoarchaeota archaeon]
MERKEVLIYFYVGIFILAAIFAAYLFNLNLTGFAVFEQNTNVTFSEGTYSNVEYNGSAIVLSANQTTGIYTSKIFNANESVTWNTLTWEGQGNLTFEIRSCSAVCSNESFITANLANLNLSSRYFQYKVSFVGYSSFNNITNVTTFFSPSLSSVSLDYSIPVAPPAPVNTTITLFQPSDTLTSKTDVPIQFGVTGENIQCWYNVKDSESVEVIGNTTLSDCANSTLSVDGDGDYVFTIYANGSSGSASQSSAFLISTPAEKKTEKEPVEQLPIEEVPVQQIPSVVTELSIQNIETSTLLPSNSKDFNLIVKNIGTEPVSACKIIASGEFASWFNIPEDSKNFNTNDEKNFSFSVTVPEDMIDGDHILLLSLQCTEISKYFEFTINVLKKRFEFSLTDVQRTRADMVRVTYSLEELLNEEQTLDMKFSLLDSANNEVATVSENQNLSAGDIKEFRTNIPVNESLEGDLTLTVDLNSATYSSSVKEIITLGAPIGGFAIFGDNGLGTGGFILILVVVAILVGIFFIVRKMRISGTTFKDLFKHKE